MELQRGLSWFNAKTHSSILTYHFVKILVSLNTKVSVCREETLKNLESKILKSK